ncbi:MAG: class I mannose-6-phosphate isomerase [Eubacterium sp.]|nr:class I mannose-6-phosphate isomerase [Eubacterium sp.]
MKEWIRLEPVFKQMVWGGSRMREFFGYNIPGNDTGEAWCVSAHAQGDCMVLGGRFAGRTLSWLWEHERGLFGGIAGKEFPLLVKYIDAKEDLSIQVHPDDRYAGIHEDGARGKTECWYILDCKKDADIIIGHSARDQSELETMIRENRWKDLLRVRPIQAGDFFQIEPGTIHAIRKGTFLIEIQQNSDITYRLYDYGRCPGGKPRQLHLQQAMDVVKCPYKGQTAAPEVFYGQGYERATLVTCPFYTVEKYTVREILDIRQDHPFMILCVTDGSGTIDGSSVKKGDNLILPFGYGTAQIKGNLSVMAAFV